MRARWHSPAGSQQTRLVELDDRGHRAVGGAPATFNAKRAAIAAITDFCCVHGWITGDPLAGLTRTPQPKPVPRTRPRAEVDRLLRDTSHPLHDRVRWALLSETTARSEEILALDVEDLDPA